MMKKAVEIMDSIKFMAEEKEDQKELFTPNHVVYRCVIVNNNRKQYTFDYQCNLVYNEPNIEDCLYCLLSDANSTEYTTDVDDFLQEFGYTDSLESVRKGEKAYKSCKRTKKALDRLFSVEELETLNSYFENY